MHNALSVKLIGSQEKELNIEYNIAKANGSAPTDESNALLARKTEKGPRKKARGDNNRQSIESSSNRLDVEQRVARLIGSKSHYSTTIDSE
jgi:hypothetical protein